MTNYSEIPSCVIEELLAAGSDGSGGALTRTKRKLLELLLVRFDYKVFLIVKIIFNFKSRNLAARNVAVPPPAEALVIRTEFK